VKFAFDRNSKTLPETEGEPFIYIPLELEIRGPTIPKIFELKERGFTRCMAPTTPAEMGGGFLAEIACQRALTDAFCGLFMFTAAGAPSGNAGAAAPSGNSSMPPQKKPKHKDSKSTRQSVPSKGCDKNESVMDVSVTQSGDTSLMDVSMTNTSRMSIS
jgi:hypothetical protein